MSNKQPEALRLADQLKYRYGATVPTSQAAAELRRLHAANEELLEQCTKALAAWEGTGPAIILDDLRAAIATHGVAQ
jgi:hypothetical protein